MPAGQEGSNSLGLTMPPHTDTSEKGLESLIVAAMTGWTTAAPSADEAVRDASGAASDLRAAGVSGWLLGNAPDYDREYAVDLDQLRAFLRTTQKEAAEALDLFQDSPTRRKFLARLQGEIAKRGVIDVLRKGVDIFTASGRCRALASLNSERKLLTWPRIHR